MKTFRDALIEATSNGGPSLRSVAEATKVSYEQLKKLNQGKTQKTNVEDARKIAAFFGRTLEEFIDCPEMKADIELASILSELLPLERQVLVNAAKAQIAARGSDTREADSDEK